MRISGTIGTVVLVGLFAGMGAARGDSIGMGTTDGTQSYLIFDGSTLVYAAGFDSARYNRQNGFCFDPCQAVASTGSLIQAAGNSWTFSGGGSILAGGSISVDLPPGSPPPAESASPVECLAAGLQINFSGGNTPCAVYGFASGYFTGDVSVTFSGGGALISGPISFTVSDNLALGLAIAPGEYAGSYTALIDYVTLPDNPLAGFFSSASGHQVIGGVSIDPPFALREAAFTTFDVPAFDDVEAVPEPAGWCLLAGALLYFLAVRHRAWVGHQRSNVSLRS